MAELSTYALARQVMLANPGIGKERLGQLLGIVPTCAYRLQSRFKGETKGHSNHPDYQVLRQLKQAHPHWSNRHTLRVFCERTKADADRARRWLEHYTGATSAPPQLPPGLNWRTLLKEHNATPKRPVLYTRICEILHQTPEIGMQKLARLAGCRTADARRLREEWRGLTQGHLADARYEHMMRLLRARQSGRMKHGCAVKTIASECGISRTMAQVWLARFRGASALKSTQAPTQASHQPPQIPQPQTEATTLLANGTDNPANPVRVWDDIDETTRVIKCRGTQIHSPEELLCKEKVDPKTWTFAKSSTQRDESGCTHIQVVLHRKSGEHNLTELHRKLLAEFARAGQHLPQVQHENNTPNLLYVPALPDLHLGKYSWQAETGSSYNVEIARRLLMRAVAGLLQKAQHYRPAQIVFPVGNDFFNVDNMEHTTTAGTAQDEIGRWQQTFAAGKGLIVWAIEQCRRTAPVHVVMVPGNHDTQRAWYLGDTLESYYRNTPGVSIDNTPRVRKYYQWGGVLLGFTHGEENRHERLPLIMANEQPSAWANSRYREWMLGHFHCRRRKIIPADEDQSGVLVRLVPSLAAADFWHTKKGFWSRRAAEGYLYCQREGLVAEFTQSVSPDTDWNQHDAPKCPAGGISPSQSHTK